MKYYNSVSQASRHARMKIFLRLVANLRPPIRMLDVGGTKEFWQGHVPDGVRLTLLNIFEQEPLEGGEALVGDACDLSRFPKGSFDVVFSNSVLCLVGDWNMQQKMAQEIRRVGKSYFVQTANQHFPIDWRTMVPFFHWFPPRIQTWCFQRMPVGQYQRVQTQEEAYQLAVRVRDLNRSQVKQLFPEGKIVNEKIFGFTKSFMVHHGFE